MVSGKDIIANRSTAILTFVTDKFDMTFPYGLQVPLMKDLQAQDPHAICELRPTNVSRNLIVNPEPGFAKWIEATPPRGLEILGKTRIPTFTRCPACFLQFGLGKSLEWKENPPQVLETARPSGESGIRRARSLCEPE